MGGSAHPEHLERGVDADGVGAERTGDLGGDAGAGPDVEHALAGVHAGQRQQVPRGLCEPRGVDPFVRRGDVVVGPPVIHGRQGYP